MRDPQEREALCLNLFIVNTDWLINFIKEMQDLGELASIARLIRVYMKNYDCEKLKCNIHRIIRSNIINSF
ncbi:hypothetical protein V4HA_00216 [Lactococcus cremoris]|nr:hypothetical protein [Lactococcus cremoris]